MRFIVKLKAEKPARINADYRRRFISLLKKTLGEDYFSEEGPRPYTFCVYFKDAKFKGDFIDNVKGINLRFSSGDIETIVRFYNGILRLKKEKYRHRIGNQAFSIVRIEREEMKTLTGAFKTLSPLIVERIGFRNERERYITPDEEEFNISLLENVKRRYEAIKGEPLKVKEFEFIPVKGKNVLVKHYGGVLKGFLGKFILRADSELLKFVYLYGLGLRTGQGFGYIEVSDSEETEG
ncbi:CRISPR-associated endoribonuclease Cas6 [Aquifex pyrophilus]